MKIRILAFSSLLPALSHAALTDNFDTFPNGGTGWGAANEWRPSGSPNGGGAVTPTVTNTNPLNGGGNYLSVTTAVASTTLGIKRNLGSVAASPYTLTFDWRLDSPLTNFTEFNDRIHFGVNGTNSYGTDNNTGWSIGVAANSGPNNSVFPGHWYFYNNTATSGNGEFNTANMVDTGIALVSGVTYSFVVTVDPVSKTYYASISGSDSTFFEQGNMRFRNQTTDGTTHTNLLFGGATSNANDQLTWSIDNINIVPEPSTAFLAGLSGLLCFVRRRIVH